MKLIDPAFLILAHLTTSYFMLGVIWFVQLVQYPLFAFVEPRSFPHYEREHCRRIAWIVIPAMVTELCSAFLLLFSPWFQSNPTILSINMISLVFIWLSTFAIQVPFHQKLNQAYCDFTITQLVRTNWIRTALWSTRAICLSLFLLKEFSI